MMDSWAFTVIDPFDCTYNPAKQVKRNDETHLQYKKYFKEAAIKLQNGESLSKLINKK